jgi:DHA1 family tetracycline resistance protein-like MFS transporter
MKKKASLLMLFSVVFMDMIGFGFIIPLIPDYITRFGGAPALAGLLAAVYALGQFFAAPIVGRLSDKYGRKPLLLFSIGGTFLSLLLLGFSRSLILVFIARLLDGLTGGNITVAQSYIVDITDEKNRARGLGLIGMAFGLGFILGPLFGGLLSVYGLAVPAFVAAGIAFLNLLLITFQLPESLTQERKDQALLRPRKVLSFKVLMTVLRRQGTGTLLLMTLLYSFAFILFESMFAIFVADRLGLDSKSRGFLLAYVGLLVALVQGGLVGVLVKKFDERKLTALAVLIAALAMLFYSFSNSVVYLMIMLFPLSIASGITSTLLRTLLTKSVPHEEAGGTLGLSSSAESLNRVLAPMVGSFLFAVLGSWSPGVLASILLALTGYIAWKKLVQEDCLAKDGPMCEDVA